MTKTVFQKIIDKEIDSTLLYEDDFCIAINDLHPKAPIHILVIPKKAIASIMEIDESDSVLISHLIYTAKKLAKENKCEGYKLQFNVGTKGGQEIFHLHLHLLGWF